MAEIITDKMPNEISVKYKDEIIGRYTLKCNKNSCSFYTDNPFHIICTTQSKIDSISCIMRHLNDNLRSINK